MRAQLRSSAPCDSVIQPGGGSMASAARLGQGPGAWAGTAAGWSLLGPSSPCTLSFVSSGGLIPHMVAVLREQGEASLPGYYIGESSHRPEQIRGAEKWTPLLTAIFSTVITIEPAPVGVCRNLCLPKAFPSCHLRWM